VLDLVVFDDPRTARLLAALSENRAECFADPEGLQEIERVLGYPELKLSAAAGAQALERYRSLVHKVVAGDVVRLPQCSDPDDQKFLTLAVSIGADFLVTRDRALLDMAERVRRIVPSLQIVPPETLSKILAATR
jgi:putative PIN family toxin of toxin-antitoxin system